MTTEGMQKGKGNSGSGNIRKWVGHWDLPHWQPGLRENREERYNKMVYGCGMLRTAWEGGKMHSSFAFSLHEHHLRILFWLKQQSNFVAAKSWPIWNGSAELLQYTIIASGLKQNTFSISCTLVTDSYAIIKQTT